LLSTLILALCRSATLGSKGKPVGFTIKKPDFRDFHNRIWSGEISLATDEAKLNYGWVHMEQSQRIYKQSNLKMR